METPWNIRGSASQLFFQDKDAPEYQALLAITDVPHPDRSMLGSFIGDAIDPQKAARYFLNETQTLEGDNREAPKKTVSQFLSDWKTLADKLRPIRADSLSSETKTLIYERDGGCCCVTRAAFKSPFDPGLEYVHIISPHAFTDSDSSKRTALSEMLSAFLSTELLDVARSICSSSSGKGSGMLGNIWLLSTDAYEAMKKGEAYFTVQSWVKHPDTSREQSYDIETTNWIAPSHRTPVSLSRDTMRLENRMPQAAPIPNQELLGFHARLSKTLAWMDTKEYMDESLDNNATKRKQFRPFFPSFLSRFLRKIWTTLPSFIRASVYDRILRFRIVDGPLLSMTTFKLPFGLYLRKAPLSRAKRHQVEFHTLQLVEKSTQIPAPRAIDVLETRHHSYLLMTCVPGRPIGQMLKSMTDQQLKQAVIDLKRYVSELRRIPKEITGFDICNPQGGGILDWRIPDSQREELRFKTEADFNKYLTDPFGKETERRAAKSHSIPHEIVFTHGDLNLRNILAEDGKITGIVDWENAGWFPEYWEFTKAHYTVRSVIRWLADVVDVVFEGYRDELVVENMLSDLLGPF